MSEFAIKDNAVAVDRTYFWNPMATCPHGVKVQLLGRGGVAAYAMYDGKNSFWKAWAPLPTLPETMK